MKKVLLLGSGGAGKTTFAIKLAAKTGLPLCHLDAHYWQPGWKEPAPADWKKKVADLVAQDAWIMDGNYSATLQLRIPPADHIILLDIPNWHCIWNVLKRRIKYARIFGFARPGMAPECPEKMDLDFLQWVWSFPKSNKPKVLETIEKHKQPGAKILVFKSFKAMEDFLSGL